MSEELVNIESSVDNNPGPLQSVTEAMATPVRIIAQLSTEESNARKDEIYKTIKSNFEHKGFRKGHVPRKIAEDIVGKEQLYRQLLSDVVRDAAEQQGLDLVAIDKIIVNNIEDESPLQLSAVIYTMPTVELPDYKNISIDVPNKPEITDNQVDIQIRNAMRSSPQTEKRDVDDRPVKKGDLITLNYKPVEDSIPEGLDPALFTGEGLTFYYREGQTRFVQAFEEALTELSMGNPIVREVPFPDDYRQPEMAGKSVTFEMELQAHQELVLPTMEDVAKEHGHDSVTEWRDDLFATLQKDVDAKYERDIENTIKMQTENSVLEEAVISPIPDTLIDQEAMSFLSQLAQMEKTSTDNYLESKGIMFDDFKEDVKPIITRKISLQVILGGIADAEGFSPSEEETNKFIENYAQMNNISFEDAQAAIDNRYVMANLRIEKGYEILKDNVTVNYV